MKRVMLVLLLITVIASCGSDKPTDPFVPIDPANLTGAWDGTYAMTSFTGTDSARTYEVEIQIIFADSSFTLTSEDTGPCGTYGGGRYQVKDRILEFEDQLIRQMICDWANILNGNFTYDYNGAGSSPAEMHMTQSFGRYSWRVDVVKQPEIVHW